MKKGSLLTATTSAVALFCTSLAHCQVYLPNDFSGQQGYKNIFYESIGDSRLINTTHRSSSGTALLSYSGNHSHEGNPPLPTYFYPTEYPLIELHADQNLLLVHPGTFGTANIGASIRIQVPTTGMFNVSGAFARANPNGGYGDGVDVLVVKGMDLDHPLFASTITSAHLVPADPFTGTGVVSFNLNLSLNAGDLLRFVVFSDNQGQDGTFDGTAFRVAIVPEPSVIGLAGLGALVALHRARRIRL